MSTVKRIETRQIKQFQRKRVAAYARVSVDTEQLMHSLSAQVSYYSNLIQGTPEWEYVGVYIDAGITGTDTKPRERFQEMIADCESGKIDIILTKSISRFARNTVDLLATVRHLKELGVEVRFEREHVNTFTSDGEVMLSILASFAEQESISLSQNIKWRVRKNYEQGKPHAHLKLYGYRWEGDERVIEPDEAEVVRFIFAEYLSGKSFREIATELDEKEIRSVRGTEHFSPQTIRKMIRTTGSFQSTAWMIITKQSLIWIRLLLLRQCGRNAARISFIRRGTPVPTVGWSGAESAGQRLSCTAPRRASSGIGHVMPGEAKRAATARTGGMRN